MKNKGFLSALGVLIGTMVGAGVFGIPYVFSRSGALISVFYLVVLFFVSLLLNLFFGEIILRTKEAHRLVGYSDIYLGKTAKVFLTFSIFFGIIGSLLVYIILAGDFLSIVIPFSLSQVQFVFISWFILSSLVFLGIRTIALSELIMGFVMFLVCILIFILAIPKVEVSNFVLADKSHIFLPFGIFLFSLICWNAVSDANRVLKRKKDLKKAIFLALLIGAIFYLIFGILLSGVSGINTTEEVFKGLTPFLGGKIIILGAIFGLLAVATSFLTLASYFKNTLVLDYKISRFLAFVITSFVPLIFYFLGINQFLKIVSFIGGFVGLIDGTIICLIYLKAKKMGDRVPEYSLKFPKFLIFFSMAILVFGAVSQIIYYLK